MRTGSTPPNSPPWSAPDSIGYPVWNRLTRHGVPASGAGITVSGNTSAIHDRHMSFIGSLTAQPPGLASTAPPRRVDDLRVFRHAAVTVVAIAGQRWPISISDAAVADSTRTGIAPQTATDMRGDIVGLSLATSLARELPPINRVSEAYARAVAPTTRPEPSASISAGVESRLARQKNSPVLPITTTNETVALTADAMAYGPSAPVSRPFAPAGVVRTLSYNVGTLGRWSLVHHSPAGSASVALSLPVAIDRRKAAAPSLLTGAHTVVVRDVATPRPGNLPVLVSRPTPAPLPTAMSYVPQSPLALARSISDAGLLQRTDVLFGAVPPPLVNRAFHSSGASASLNHSITHPSITRHIEYTQAAFSHRSVNRLPIDADISVRPITREHDPEGQVIDTEVSSVAASSIPPLSRLVVPPLELRDRLDLKPQRGALRTAPQETGGGPVQIAFSERSIDSPVGLSPAAPDTIPLPRIEPMVRRAAAAFTPAVLARANMSPIGPLEHLRIIPDDIFASSASDGGLARASFTAAPSVPPLLQSPSAGPSPLAQAHRVSGYFERGVLRIASQEVPVVPARLPHSELSVDSPVRLSRALSPGSASPGIQLMALRAKGGDGVAFPLTNVVPSPTGQLRQSELPMISQSFIAATRGVGQPMRSTSSAPRFADTTWPLPGPLTDVLRSPAAQLRQAAPPVISDALVTATGSAGEPIMLPPGQPRSASTVWPPGPLTDVVRSPTADLRQAEPPVISDSFIAATGGVGQSMVLTSTKPRSASTAWPPGPLTNVVRSPTAQLRQAEPPVISDSLIAATRDAGEAATREVGEPTILTADQSRLAGTKWPLARSVSLPQMIGGHASGGRMIFFDLAGQSVANALLPHRAFDDRGSPFPSASYNGISTEPRRSDLPLRVALRRYDAAIPPVRSGAAGAQVLVPTPIAVARAESPVSALHDPAASAVVAGSGTPLDVGPRSDTSPSAPFPDSGADADDIIERAWREVMSRLAIEQERRGYGRWS